MTRKDYYVLIARAVANAAAPCIAGRDNTGNSDIQRALYTTACGAVSTVAHALADELAGTNPRFDSARFLKACGIEIE